VLMVERFDREHTDGGYLRFGLVSAFTMLDVDEHYLDRERWSYPLLADELRRWSRKPKDDRIELFRRMIFNAAVTNNDDHPRNHAVRRTALGWELTPAYDLVPTPTVSLDRRDLAMTVGTYGRVASIYNLLSQCRRFGLTNEAAKAVVDLIVTTLRSWRDDFRTSGVSSKDVDYIAPAFLPETFFVDKPES
jgi:serine/threonine-protein kinase HipA